MITFSQLGKLSCHVWGLPSTRSTSGGISVWGGTWTPVRIDSLIQDKPADYTVRSRLDYLRTGRKLFAGDHECQNFQVQALVAAPLESASGSVFNVDTSIKVPNQNGWKEIVVPSFADLFEPECYTQLIEKSTTKYACTPFKIYPELHSNLREISVPLCLPDSSAYTDYAAARYLDEYHTVQVLRAVQACQHIATNDQGYMIYIITQYFVNYVFDVRNPANAPSWSSDCQSFISMRADPSSSGYFTYDPTKCTWWIQSYHAPGDQFDLLKRTGSTFPSDPKGILQFMDLHDPNPTGYIPDPLMDSIHFTTNVDRYKNWSNGDVDASSKSVSLAECKQRVADIDNRIVMMGDIIRSSFDSVTTDWGEMADECLDNINYLDIDSIAYLRDLKESGSTLKAILAMKSGVKDPRAWAKLWLSLRYADRLELADTADLVKASKRFLTAVRSIPRHEWQVSRTRHNFVCPPPCACFGNHTVSCSYKLYYKPKEFGPVGDFVRKSMEVDLWPTFDNMWDLLPLSFVVDWFVDVQGICQDLDRSIEEEYFDILSVIYSERHVLSFSSYSIAALKDPDLVDVSVISYKRKHAFEVHPTPFRVQRGHLSTNNFVDGLCLLIQRH